MSETAHDVAFDEGNGINSPTNLGLEATFINQNFSQQCLKKGQDKKVFPNSNPFVTDEDEAQVASVAYRYGDGLTDELELCSYLFFFSLSRISHALYVVLSSSATHCKFINTCGGHRSEEYQSLDLFTCLGHLPAGCDV